MTLKVPSIENFRALIPNGVQRPYRYYVMFRLPAAVAGKRGDFTEVVSAFAYNVSLPSKQIETSNWQHLGKARQMPTHVVYPPTQMTFLCDSQMKIKKMLDAWQAYICEPSSYYMNYYDEFARQSCVVMSLDEMGMPSYAVRLNEFWPRRVDEIRFSAQGSNEPATVEAEFVFKDWYNTDTMIALGEDIDSALGIERDQYILRLIGQGEISQVQAILIRDVLDRTLGSLDSGLGRLAGLSSGATYGIINGTIIGIKSLFS